MKGPQKSMRRFHRRSLIKGVAAAGLGLAAGGLGFSGAFAQASVSKNGKQNRIQKENAKPGTRDWLLTKNYDTAEPTTQHPQTQIKGTIQS
jgi:hypothetical protein